MVFIIHIYHSKLAPQDQAQSWYWFQSCLRVLHDCKHLSGQSTDFLLLSVSEQVERNFSQYE